MKSVWKGSLSFGLVSIPVQLFTAHEIEALGFNLLHAKCLTPLKYHRWCPHCKKDVSWENTVKGIKKSDGTYLTLTKEMLHKLRPEKTEEIRIIEFVDMKEIPVIYLNHHYYVAPTKQANTAYALFIEALQSLNKVAIGRFVMRDKEYTCAIQTSNNYLVLTTLFYAYETRGLENLAFTKKVKINSAELKLAQQMIQKLSVKKFDISQFKDTFAQKIKKMLEQKTKKIKRTRKKEIVDDSIKKGSLSHALRESIKKIKHPVVYAKKR